MFYLYFGSDSREEGCELNEWSTWKGVWLGFELGIPSSKICHS